MSDDPNKVIVSIAHARVHTVEAEVPEEELLIEAETEEPEVIGKVKEEEGGESEA